MTKEIFINKKCYVVNKTEFLQKPHIVYNNLAILDELGYQERIVSLLRELSTFYQQPSLGCYGIAHGGFIPLQASSHFERVAVLTADGLSTTHLLTNMQRHNVKNIVFTQSFEVNVIYTEGRLPFDTTLRNSLVLSPTHHILDENYKYKYRLEKTQLFMYVPDLLHHQFVSKFVGCFSDNVFSYNNLLHLTMIVKNAGDNFEQVLKNNLPYIDRWTILDTGSTDNTIDIIKKVLVGTKMGQLYQEPFINFRDSRNRCLDLAGKSCKFVIMLDDTYMIKGILREFLEIVRGDQFADSFSMYIQSADNEYVSNRILKTENNLKYMFRIHEVIQEHDNKNVCVPLKEAWIFDHRSDYMETRTMNRKYSDLKLLFEEVRDDPTNPRHYYYIGQTYNLLEKHELAYEYFLKRAEHPNKGFNQERLDAYFEAARIANFKLNKPWDECERLYKKAYELDNNRPESLYFIGVHYYLHEDKKVAYEYMKQAYEKGYPEQSQYSLKPTLSYHYVPKFLSELCYYYEDYSTGLDACKLFLQKNKVGSDFWEAMKSWADIYNCLVRMPPLETPIIPVKPWLIFVADGGFEPWTGHDIERKGMGGSETFIIEMAKYIQQSQFYNVIVFCKCNEESIYEGVKYIPLLNYFSFVRKNRVNVCIISRYSEYLPVALKSHVDNVYMIAHDLSFTGIVIPTDPKLKQIFCLTDWHVQYFVNSFSSLKDITSSFGYGLDTDVFNYEHGKKVGYNFIYSSFPNRGLLPLLKMWEKIIHKYPTASLDIYCDLDGNWVNENTPEIIKEIKQLLLTYKNMNISYHGWVDKNTLATAWKKAHVWLYPCTFMETFCLTALEAAATKTLVVTCPLAGLINTVGDRGIIIQGNANTEEWQEQALLTLFNVLEQKDIMEQYVQKNYEWVKNNTWKNKAKLFLNMLGNQPQDTLINYYKKRNPGINKVLEVGGETDIEIQKVSTLLTNSVVNTHKQVIFGLPTLSLIDIIRREDQYDFVYVEGEYTEMLLSLEVLKPGGFLKINRTTKEQDVQKFLTTIRKKYILLRTDEEYIYIEKK